MNHLRVSRENQSYVACFPLHEVDSRSDVSPLVAPSDLADAAKLLVEVQKIVRLQALIGKLGEAQAVLRVDSLVHAVFSQHALDAHIPSMLKQYEGYFPTSRRKSITPIFLYQS